MGAYDFNFDLPAGESFAPTPERVAAYAKLLPKDNFGFAPRVTDRDAWDKWQEDPFGQYVLSEARRLAKEPTPELTDDAFNRCLDDDSVTEINVLIPAVRERNTVFLLAEAIFDQGEFLKVIESDARQLGQLGTWIHPGNDLDRKNLRRETFDNDLGSCHHAVNFAQFYYILGPRLSEDFRNYLSSEVDRRFFSPLRNRIEAERDIDWWLIVKHNWNPVCLSCYAHAAAAMLPRVQDRAWWFAFAEMHTYNFTDGFADDGLCTEASPTGVTAFRTTSLSLKLSVKARATSSICSTPPKRDASRVSLIVRKSNPVSGPRSATASSMPNRWSGPACGSTIASRVNPTS